MFSKLNLIEAAQTGYDASADGFPKHLGETNWKNAMDAILDIPNFVNKIHFVSSKYIFCTKKFIPSHEN